MDVKNMMGRFPEPVGTETTRGIEIVITLAGVPIDTLCIEYNDVACTVMFSGTRTRTGEFLGGTLTLPSTHDTSRAIVSFAEGELVIVVPRRAKGVLPIGGVWRRPPVRVEETQEEIHSNQGR